jgi:hypothetical protein
MNPTQEKAIETSAGMETATQTVDRIKGALAQPVNASNVPMSMVSQPTPDLQLPPPGVVPIDSGVTGEGRTLVDRMEQAQIQEKEQAGKEVSDSVRAIHESLGILNTESATREELEGKAGVSQMTEGIRKFQESIRRQVAQLDQFDIDFTNQMEQERIDAGRRGGTKGQFSAFSAEENLKMAVQRANMARQLRTTIAANDMAQGDLQSATEQVDKALNAIYEPERQKLQMEMFFLERNDRRFDSAQKDLANTRMMQIQREQAQMDRAENMVHEAVINGYARPEEVQELTSPDSTPRERQALAQSIINRGAAQERGLRLEQLSMSIAASRAQMAQLGQPDANAQLIQSLFGQAQPSMSFQDFLAEKGLANMSLPPETLAEMEAEYNSTFAVDPEQQQQVLSYLVATGGVSVQQAEFMQKNLNMMTADQKAKQETTILRGQTVLRDVERALTQVDKAGKISGYTAESQRWVGTGPSIIARFSPAFELQQHLESIKSNVSIDQLQAMREASPTGGALGQVPVQQQVFLMQVLGSLSPSLDSAVLEENLNDVYNIYLDVMFGSPDELSGQVKNARMTATQANSYLQQRKETGFNDFNLPMAKSGGQDIGNLVIAPNGDLVRVK